MLLATWQGKFSILFFPLRILSGTLNPATVVCGVDAVSARVAPVPHLVRYDWPFFRTAVDRASKRYLSRRA